MTEAKSTDETVAPSSGDSPRPSSGIRGKAAVPGSTVAPPVSAPPVSAPPVSAPPVSAPPVSAPPVSGPPAAEQDAGRGAAPAGGAPAAAQADSPSTPVRQAPPLPPGSPPPPPSGRPGGSDRPASAAPSSGGGAGAFSAPPASGDGRPAGAPGLRPGAGGRPGDAPGRTPVSGAPTGSSWATGARPTASPSVRQPSFGPAGTATPRTAQVSEAVRTARKTVSAAASRGPRRARLQVKKIDPWSTMKFSFAVSLVLFIAGVVATAILYMVLDALGVWESLNKSVGTLNPGADPAAGVDLPLTAKSVIGAAALLGALNMLLFTALATLGAFIYNVCADLVGGIEVMLAERE